MPSTHSKCYKFQITGHFSKAIKKIKQPDKEIQQNTDEICNTNLTNQYNDDFKVEVVINNSLVKVTADR